MAVALALTMVSAAGAARGGDAGGQTMGAKGRRS